VVRIALCAALLPAAAGTAKADEVDRIREKAGELARAIVSENYSHLAEGKESNLSRVYKDFDYLLKDSKTAALEDAIGAAGDPVAKGQLERTHQFLIGERIFYPVASSWDNAESYARSASMAVQGSDVELNLNSYQRMLAGAADRSNRRIWYLASRDLRENANVFQLNVSIDLDKHAQEIAGTDYDTFLAGRYQIDPAAIEALAQQVLASTKDEYEALLGKVTPAAIEGMTVAELREYDVPYLLRMSHLDDSFEKGKYQEVAAKWLKDFGIDLRGAKKLRIVDDVRVGKSGEPGTFPLDNGNDTRISLLPVGGLPDYWHLFDQLGRGLFYYHIGPQLGLADARLGSPVIPMTFGALFQEAMATPEWQVKYLEPKDAAEVADGIRFRQLFDLRRAAARYVFYRRMYTDIANNPPSAYATFMQETMLWNHGATEEADYLLCDDQHRSGMALLAAVRAAQLRAHLAGQFGETWWSSPEAGQWLKSQWARGFEKSPGDLFADWGIGDADAAALTP
jgi:hypothetical protein